MTLPRSVRPKMRYLQLFIGNPTVSYRYVDKKQAEQDIAEHAKGRNKWSMKVLEIDDTNMFFNDIAVKEYKMFTITKEKKNEKKRVVD